MVNLCTMAYSCTMVHRNGCCVFGCFDIDVIKITLFYFQRGENGQKRTGNWKFCNGRNFSLFVAESIVCIGVLLDTLKY